LYSPVDAPGCIWAGGWPLARGVLKASPAFLVRSRNAGDAGAGDVAAMAAAAGPRRVRWSAALLLLVTVLTACLAAAFAVM
jgi:hypothetical protein